MPIIFHFRYIFCSPTKERKKEKTMKNFISEKSLEKIPIHFHGKINAKFVNYLFVSLTILTKFYRNSTEKLCEFKPCKNIRI